MLKSASVKMDNYTYNATLSIVAAHVHVESDYTQTNEIFNAVDTSTTHCHNAWKGKMRGPGKGDSKIETMENYLNLTCNRNEMFLSAVGHLDFNVLEAITRTKLDEFEYCFCLVQKELAKAMNIR